MFVLHGTVVAMLNKQAYASARHKCGWRRSRYPFQGEAILNPGLQDQFAKSDPAERGTPQATDQVARTIVATVGIAGAILAAIVGYLIESAAMGGTAGFAGALVCPLVFSALYRSFPPPNA